MLDLSERSILIIGAGGFVGRSLVPILEKQGAHVLTLARGAIAAVQPQTLRKIRSCVHLAGNGNVGVCEKDPEGAYQSNVELTGRTLMECRRLGVNRFVFPSTARVYGSGRLEPYRETDPVSPAGVYASTKLLAELWVRRAAKGWGMQTWILRMTNVYGQDSSPETVLGSLLKQVWEGKSVLQLAKASPVRDFIFVEDVGEAISRVLLENPSSFGGTLNLSTGQGTSIGELGRLVAELSGLRFDSQGKEETDPLDYLVLSNQGIRERLGWIPRHSLREGLAIALKR